MVSTRSAEVPHSLQLLIEFVNTLDPDDQSDELATAEGLRSWLAQRRLLRPDNPSLTESERQAAVRLREALRALMLANNGADADPAAAAELDEVTRAGELGITVTDDGSAQLVARAGGLAGALGRLVLPVAEGAQDGSWRRVKACRAGDCLWAFYDRSRNRSGVWCDMAVCGNREKVRAYRKRGNDGGHAGHG